MFKVISVFCSDVFSVLRNVLTAIVNAALDVLCAISDNWVTARTWVGGVALFKVIVLLVTGTIGTAAVLALFINICVMLSTLAGGMFIVFFIERLHRLFGARV